MIAASPDGTRVAIAGDRGEIRLRDADGGKREEIIPALGAPVLALAFSPDGDRILAGYADRTARLFDAESRAVVGTLTGHLGPVNAVSFSPDGRRLVGIGPPGAGRLAR